MFDFNNSKSVGFVERIVKLFADIEVEDRKEDRGVSVTESPKDTPYQPFSHMQSGGYGPYKRYVNYEEATKGTKIRIYRQMAEYPEIGYALDTLVNEIVNPDETTGDVITMEILDKDMVEHVNKKHVLRKEWDYVFYDLLHMNKDCHDMIKSFLILGEVAFEKVANFNKPEQGLKRVRRLAVESTFPVYDDTGDVTGFQLGQAGKNGQKLVVPKETIAYARYGDLAYNQDTGERVALSYLEKVKKVWRQLQLLEEAVVIYRIVRAPERRVWKIATGNMPKSQALAYIEDLKMQYRQRKTYNPVTGEVGGQANILNMLEDFWFSQPDSGNGSDVQTLPGGDNLGEIRDLDYFLKKLYLAMRIPENKRLETAMGQPSFNSGDMGEINHQEVMFAKMANRIAMRIQDMVFDVFKTHLKMKGIWKLYNLKDRDFAVKFKRNTYFEELKQASLEEKRMNLFGTVASFIGEIFSKEYAVKKYLHFSEEDWNENERLMEKEKQESNVDQGQGIMGGF
jgi:hypothetical protein